MDRQSLTLGRIFGIPFRIDYSWFLIFILVTWSLASSYFPAEFKNWHKAVYWIAGGLTAILFFASVLLHELAHSLVAGRFKIVVRRITLHIFGGISELMTEPATAGATFWITLAGPLANLALGGLLTGLAALAAPLAVEPLWAGLKYLAFINLVLGGFNLLPGLPLDGGSILMALIWQITRRKNWGMLAAASVGSFLAYLFLLVGSVQVIYGNLMNGLWTAFLGWVLLNTSGSALRRERLHEALLGHSVAEAMSRGYTIVYASTTLQALADEHILSNGRHNFLVKQEGAIGPDGGVVTDSGIVGILTVAALQKVPRDAWPATTVEEVMIPTSAFQQIRPDSGIADALEEMERAGANQLPVTAEGQVLGVLTREDVINFLRDLQAAKRR